MSELVTDNTVMCLCFLFGELGEVRNGKGSFNRMVGVIAEVENGFSSRGKYGGGNTFHSDQWFYNEGRRSVHRGKSHRWGLREGRDRFLSGLI